MTAVMLVRSAEGARVAGAIASICPSSRRLRPAHEPMRTLYYSFSLNDAVPRNHLVRRLAAAQVLLNTCESALLSPVLAESLCTSSSAGEPVLS